MFVRKVNIWAGCMLGNVVHHNLKTHEEGWVNTIKRELSSESFTDDEGWCLWRFLRHSAFTVKGEKHLSARIHVYLGTSAPSGATYWLRWWSRNKAQEGPCFDPRHSGGASSFPLQLAWCLLTHWNDVGNEVLITAESVTQLSPVSTPLRQTCWLTFSSHLLYRVPCVVTGVITVTQVSY